MKVEMQGDVVLWRDFAPASPEADAAFTPAPHVARTGPFRFDREQYHRVLVPFSR